MNTYQSMKEFQDSVYAAAIGRKSLNDMCQSQCKKGTVKSKVRSSKDDNSSMNMTSSNLSSVAQDYVNNHLKVTKVHDQTLDCSEPGVTYTRTYHKISQSSSLSQVSTSTNKSIEITGNVSYGAASLQTTASYSNTVDTYNQNSSSTYNEDTVTMTFNGGCGVVEIWHDSYTCSDSPVLDVIYNFDTISIHAGCTYKGDTGIPFDNGGQRNETRIYNLSDLGFNGPFLIKTPTTFDVRYSDEWPSNTITK